MNQIFPLFYFPKISWWKQLINQQLIDSQLKDGILILNVSSQYEQIKHYNRCQIKGPNKIQYLTVPVYRHSKKLNIDQAVIANEENWRTNHIKSIQSAYGKTAFFEYYSTEIFETIRKPYNSLYELNIDCIDLIAKFLHLDVNYKFIDIPSNIHSDYLILSKYYQPFGDFLPDLSILDLIFNLGSEAILFLSEPE